jgi:hypothetical protein
MIRSSAISKYEFFIQNELVYETLQTLFDQNAVQLEEQRNLNLPNESIKEAQAGLMELDYFQQEMLKHHLPVGHSDNAARTYFRNLRSYIDNTKNSYSNYFQNLK